ncbi:MAG: HAD family phosphatase [Deltaproteobacteria bacterium]|nr:HAD family phosphatase [Deltaproteobacteria bacterium]
MSTATISNMAVLWDLDGTLIDSANIHYQAWCEVLAQEGQRLSTQEFATNFGKRNDEILRQIFSVDMSAERIENISEKKEQTYRGMLKTAGLKLLPGAAAWLERLQATGWQQALASSAPHANIDAAFAALGLGKFLNIVVSADDVGEGKPNPAVFIEAARRLNISAKQCIVVEDAPAGIEAAKRAGMHSIGVLSEHHSQLSADIVVASLEALPENAFIKLLAQERS